jgi:DNA-binding HxlR family transcriptional regulator
LQNATGCKHTKLVVNCNQLLQIRMNSHRSYCPINLAMEVLGDKWSLLIIRDMMFAGKQHFREFLQSEEKIASNILTDRLALLEREGLVTKRQAPDHSQKYIYRLTEKGIDLLPSLVALSAWSIKYNPVDLNKHKHAKVWSKAGLPEQVQLKKELLKKRPAKEE